MSMSRSLAVAGCLVILVAAGDRSGGAEEVQVESAAGKVTVTRGPLSLVFDAAGRGFVSSARRGDVEVCAEYGKCCLL
jgi:hypothetical protein